MHSINLIKPEVVSALLTFQQFPFPIFSDSIVAKFPHLGTTIHDHRLANSIACTGKIFGDAILLMLSFLCTLLRTHCPQTSILPPSDVTRRTQAHVKGSSLQHRPSVQNFSPFCLNKVDSLSYQLCHIGFRCMSIQYIGYDLTQLWQISFLRKGQPTRRSCAFSQCDSNLVLTKELDCNISEPLWE